MSLVLMVSFLSNSFMFSLFCGSLFVVLLCLMWPFSYFVKHGLNYIRMFEQLGNPLVLVCSHNVLLW